MAAAFADTETPVPTADPVVQGLTLLCKGLVDATPMAVDAADYPHGWLVSRHSSVYLHLRWRLGLCGGHPGLHLPREGRQVCLPVAGYVRVSLYKPRPLQLHMYMLVAIMVLPGQSLNTMEAVLNVHRSSQPSQLMLASAMVASTPRAAAGARALGAPTPVPRPLVLATATRARCTALSGCSSHCGRVGRGGDSRLLLCSSAVAASGWAAARRRARRRPCRRASRVLCYAAASASSQSSPASECDVVVIGSGLGGLTCAGVLAAAGKRVTVLEAHYEAGGAAHTFTAKAKGVEGEFLCDCGPSLYGGLSRERSSSPLKHLFQIVGEEPEWITYDRWNAFIPEGEANAAIGYEEFVSKLLPQFGGPDAKQQWDRLMRQLGPLAEVVVNGPPPGAVREDLAALLTLGRYVPKLKAVPGGPQKLSEPFDQFLKEAGVSDPFINNWMNMFAFLLQGLPCYGAPTSMMAYMMADMYNRNACLDYPKGGNIGIVDAMVRGITKRAGCEVHLKTPVEEILVGGGRATGVRIRGGHVVHAREAVVSNVDWRVTRDLVPSGASPELDDHFRTAWEDYPMLKSFIHLHLGFRGEGLPASHCESFPAQWGVFNHWRDLEERRNAVLVSCPSMLDASLAPPGHHVLHAYTPATEPWEEWKDLERGSDEYKRKKAEARDFLLAAVEKQVPDVRDRIAFEMVGTPLTHRRFLRKPAGSYGPRVMAPEMLPGHKTPLEGLHMCGDSTFPGIGVPAVVMSGHICANNLLSPWEHWKVLDRIKEWKLQLAF